MSLFFLLLPQISIWWHGKWQEESFPYIPSLFLIFFVPSDRLLSQYTRALALTIVSQDSASSSFWRAEILYVWLRSPKSIAARTSTWAQKSLGSFQNLHSFICRMWDEAHPASLLLTVVKLNLEHVRKYLTGDQRGLELHRCNSRCWWDCSLKLFSNYPQSSQMHLPKEQISMWVILSTVNIPAGLTVLLLLQYSKVQEVFFSDSAWIHRLGVISPLFFISYICTLWSHLQCVMSSCLWVLQRDFHCKLYFCLPKMQDRQGLQTGIAETSWEVFWF